MNVAKSKAQLALIKYHKGDDVKEIETLFTDARNIIGARLGATNPLYAEILKNLSLAYSRDGRTKEAFLLLNQSEKIWEKRLGRRNNINLASIYVLEGDIYYHQYDYENADKKYNQAKKLYEKVFNDRHPNYVKVVSRLARVEFMEGDIKKSRKLIEEAIDNYNYFIKVYFPALSEREKAKFWNTIKHDFEFYNTIAVKLMRSDEKVVRKMYNNALLTKSLLLNSSIKMRERILNSGDTVLISRYQEWIEKKELMTNVLSMSLEQLMENEIDPGVLEHELELLEKELSEKSELFSQSFEDKKITWMDVKESLKPNEAAIEMVRFRYFDHALSDSVIYAALWIKQELEDRPEIILLTNGKDLEHKYYKFRRNSIKFKLKDQVSYAQFWQPIENKVGAYSTIYLSADGIYNQINMEAIAIDDTKYVLDNSNIILISNTRDIYIRRHQGAKPQALRQNNAIMFGNPTFYVDASNTTSSENAVVQLPGTQKEIEELSKLLSSQGWEASDYLNLAATEDQVKQSNSPKVFHIATHGFFTSNEDIEEALEDLELSEAKAIQNPLLRTGLMLAGAGDLLDKTSFNYNVESGILTAYEAMNLNFDYTDLVVLSACETGLGDVQIGEGVYGLQRAFLVAGAKVLIMRLFKVSDEATQKLMVKFYQRWLGWRNKI